MTVDDKGTQSQKHSASTATSTTTTGTTTREARALEKKRLAAPLYPSRSRLARHVFMMFLRVPIVCTLMTFIIHPLMRPLYDLWVEQTGVENSGIFMISLGLTLHTFVITLYFSFFLFCDHFKVMQQYKIKRTKRMEAKPELRKKAFTQIIFFHLVTRVALGMFLGYFLPYPHVDFELESVFGVWMFWVWAVFTGEVFTFYYHKLQHDWKWLYQYHKIHHEFYATEVLTTEYGDPFEVLFYVFLNYVTTLHKPMSMHFVIVIWKMTESAEGHSGYSFRGTWLSKIGLMNGYRAEFHDYHHSHNLGTYGLHGFMDYWKGTCDDFLLYQKEQGKSALDD